MDIPILGGSRSATNVDYRDSLPVNLSIIIRDIKGDQGYLLSHDGLTEISNQVDIDRGGIWNSRQQKHLRVSGQNLISVNSDNSIDVVGLIAGQNQVSLPYSFQTQGILSDNKFYLYDGLTLSTYSDPDVGFPIDAVNINNIYVFTDGENIYHTDATNEFSISAEKFATNEFSPDRTIALLKDTQNQLVVFDRYSTGWFFDNGGSGFRFTRIQGKFSKVGIVGTHCKIELDGQLFILGNRKEESPSIHILTGSNETTVATREIDYILESYSESELSKTALEARTRKREKILLVRLLRHTLEFNFEVFHKFGKQFAWTIIKSDIQGDNPWRGRNGVFDPQTSRWIYGDSLEGKLAFLDDSSSLQYGERVEEIFYTPTVYLEGRSINLFELDTLPGYSNDDVNLSISISYDSVTYGQEFPIEVSKIGDYNTRCMGFELGYVEYNFNFKFRSTSGSKMAYSGLRIEHD